MTANTATRQLIRVGHSPDPDDAFMFHALANGKIDTGPYEFRHELVDIETLNRRAFSGELELSAVSIHAYAYLTDKYLLCPCGASMGDRYGPMVVAPRQYSIDDLRRCTSSSLQTPDTRHSDTPNDRRARHADHGLFGAAAVPGPRFQARRRAVRSNHRCRRVGPFEGQTIDAGLIIHEGQLTYGDRGLKLAVDLGQWWFEHTAHNISSDKHRGLPLPLGGNVLRRDLGPETIREVNRLLKESIRYGLDHREEALQYALQYGRDLDRPRPTSLSACT